MYTWVNATLTLKGTALMSKLTSGQSLSLVRAAAGAGYVEPDRLKYLSGVSDERQELKFSGQSYPEEGKCAVPVRLINTGLTGGYTAMQIGIYAMDPDDGEILFLIAQASNEAGTPIPSATEMPGYSAEWTFYLQYGQADGVTVMVNPANTVSEAEVRTILSEHTTDKDNPHGVTKEQLGLGNVDNTADTDKMVAFAIESAAARKVNSALTIRLNGGRTEGSNMCTFDGSVDKSINITLSKIGGAVYQLKKTDDEISLTGSDGTTCTVEDSSMIREVDSGAISLESYTIDSTKSKVFFVTIANSGSSYSTLCFDYRAIKAGFGSQLIPGTEYCVNASVGNNAVTFSTEASYKIVHVGSYY